MSSLTQLPLFDMIEIPLTKGYKAIVDVIDGDLAQFKWSICGEPWHYARRAIYPYEDKRKQQIIMMHRLILERQIGRFLIADEIGDHIDGNILNNQRSNLRVVNSCQSMWNTRRSARNTSGFRGVYAYKGGWRANISINGKRIHLGCFKSLDEAAKVYEKAAEELYGEFRRVEP